MPGGAPFEFETINGAPWPLPELEPLQIPTEKPKEATPPPASKKAPEEKPAQPTS